MSTQMDGHLYTVCAGTDFANSKCGFTIHDVWSYLKNNYARTMVPLTIRKVLHVPYARLAESMLFCAIDSYRKAANHEVFDIDDDTLTQSFESVKTAFDALTAGNPFLTKCTFVESRAASSRTRRRNKSSLSVNQIAKKAAAERRKQRVDAYNLRMQQEQQETREKEANIEKLLTAFISTICSTSPDLKVGSVALLAAYNKFAPDHTLLSTAFNAKMKAKGYIKKVIRLDGELMQGFVGLALHI